MPEMAVVIDGHPADVHPYPRRIERNEGFLRAAEAVVDFQHGIEIDLRPPLIASATKDRIFVIVAQIEISGVVQSCRGAAAGEKSDRIEEIPARG
jgi:hypothetical protein